MVSQRECLFVAGTQKKEDHTKIIAAKSIDYPNFPVPKGMVRAYIFVIFK